MVTWDLITPRSVLLAIDFSTQEFMFKDLIIITVPNIKLSVSVCQSQIENLHGHLFSLCIDLNIPYAYFIFYKIKIHESNRLIF